MILIFLRGVSLRVEGGKECWSYQIESLTALVKIDNRVTTQEAHSLMQVLKINFLDRKNSKSILTAFLSKVSGPNSYIRIQLKFQSGYGSKF